MRRISTCRSVAVDNKNGLALPAAVLPDPPARLALPVYFLDKVEFLPLEDIFVEVQLFRPPTMQQAINGHGKEQVDPD